VRLRRALDHPALWLGASVVIGQVLLNRRSAAEEQRHARLVRLLDAANRELTATRVAQMAEREREAEAERCNWDEVLQEILEDIRALSCVYQPIVRLEDHSVAGHEALARPASSSVTDSVEPLFAAASRLGRTAELDWVCRRTALAEAIDCGLPLFINISAQALLDPIHSPDQMLLLTRWNGWSARRVVLEVNERDVLDRLERLAVVTAGYRELGFRFALDDAGQGAGTIEVMRAIGAEFVNLSPHLVARIDEPGVQSHIRTLVGAADSLGSELVAVGVETEHAAAEAASLGVRLGQGYALARPQPGKSRMPHPTPAAVLRPAPLRDSA
jgi:EAL domain-containing protein (putative c-di-GMP-specific phosphodiesterase class I)